MAEISAQNDAFLYYCEYGCLLSCSERCLWQPGPWIQAHLRQTGTSHLNNSGDDMCFCDKEKVSKKTASAYIQTKINTSHLYLQCPLADWSSLCPLGDSEHAWQTQQQAHLQSSFARNESDSAVGLQAVYGRFYWFNCFSTFKVNNNVTASKTY